MALRAFHANPSIGGFGNENSNVLPLGDPLARKNNRTNDDSRVDVGGEDFSNESGDALCQIVKELVDNAVDACETARKDYAGSIVYRVKVEIRPYRNNSDDNTLQVTVSDNGCGMKDIQACVNAFQSSKGGYSNTVGRYGIGLTLCLLHAQRLVWGTYSCITSATKESTSFKRALYIVNTDGDSVECHREEEVEKGHAAESGTCVSLLVPVSSRSIDFCIACVYSHIVPTR